MTPYARKFVSVEDFKLLQRVKLAVNELPDLDLGKNDRGQQIVLSCHMLARAVGSVFSLRVVDGRYCHRMQHSWNVLASGHIIDAYPIAVLGGPILLESNTFHLAHEFYVAGDLGIDFSEKSFVRCVEEVTEAMRSLVAAKD